MPGRVIAAVLAVLVGGAGAVGLADRARAQAIVSTGPSHLSTALLVGERRADGTREAGLVIDVAPGWKTYWRNPGEAGVPPRFDWSGSENLAEVRIRWPRPIAFESFGMRTLGYSGRVVLPLTLVPEQAEDPVALGLDAEFGVCRDICLFEQARLARDIAPAAPADDGAARLLAAAEASVPPPGREAGVRVLACRIAGAGADRDFSARLALPEAAGEPIVVLEGAAETWFRGQSVERTPGRLEITATLSTAAPGTWVSRDDVRITLLAPGFAADVEGCRGVDD